MRICVKLLWKSGLLLEIRSEYIFPLFVGNTSLLNRGTELLVSQLSGFLHSRTERINLVQSLEMEGRWRDGAAPGAQRAAWGWSGSWCWSWHREDLQQVLLPLNERCVIQQYVKNRGFFDRGLQVRWCVCSKFHYKGKQERLSQEVFLECLILKICMGFPVNSFYVPVFLLTNAIWKVSGL